MRVRLGTGALAVALAAAATAAPRLPDSLGSAPDHPPPLPGSPAAPEPLAALPGDHWARPLLGKLRFPAGVAAGSPGSTRLDAALFLARWLERGEPSPEARPRLIASHLGRELVALGKSPAEVRQALDRLAPASDAPIPDDTPGRGTAARRQLSRSLEAHRALEARLEALRARRRETTP